MGLARSVLSKLGRRPRAQLAANRALAPATARVLYRMPTRASAGTRTGSALERRGNERGGERRCDRLTF
jgi:hypothetical protein